MKYFSLLYDIFSLRVHLLCLFSTFFITLSSFGSDNELAVRIFKKIPEEKIQLMVAHPSEEPFKGPVNCVLDQEDQALHDELSAHVRVLSVDIGPRNFHEYPDNLAKTEGYIRENLAKIKEFSIIEQKIEAPFSDIKKCLEENDYEFNSDAKNPVWSYDENHYKFTTMPEKYHFINFIAELKGNNQDQGRPYNIITIIAHYDTVNSSPGADDNASGVAVALTLTRMLSAVKMQNTVRFLFVPNKEAPLSRTLYMGSLHYFNSLSPEEKKSSYVMAFDAIGYFSENENSQRYHPSLAQYYSNRGNFISFIGKYKKQDTWEPEPFLSEAIRLFDEAKQIPSKFVNTPTRVYDIHDTVSDFSSESDLIDYMFRDWGHSDHWSAWIHEIPGIMITDTARIRNPHYHKPSDTREKLDYVYLTRLTQGLCHMIKELAEKESFSH